MKALDASVVVCTCNRPEHLRRCLKLLFRQDPPAAEVVVVRSGSDRTDEALFARFPGLQTIRIDVDNVSAARNAGIAATRGEAVLFIDDDAEAPAGWVGAMAAALSGEGVGAVGGTVLDGNAPEPRFEFRNGLIDPVGRQLPVREEGSSVPSGFLPNVKGCNCGFRRRALTEIGNFDEGFAFSFDEADVVLSLLEGGWRVGRIELPVLHYSAAGVYRKQSPADKNWYVEIRSQARFARKHCRNGRERFRAYLRLRLRMLKVLLLLSGGRGWRRRLEIASELRRGFRDGNLP